MHIIATVTNDLNYDQRMQRICTTLAKHGHQVMLVGRVLPHSLPLLDATYAQIRFDCIFRKGGPFYLEYNLRLFFFLLFLKDFDVLNTIDLDTMPGGCSAALLRRKKRVFDAHEYFTEVPEVVNRPLVRSIWQIVASIFIPTYHKAYTVGPALADIFSCLYGIPFGVVRNVPYSSQYQEDTSSRNMTDEISLENTKIILYQGALNEGRGLEQAIEAMAMVENGATLWLAGEGDLSAELRRLVTQLRLEHRVKFLGYKRPEELKLITAKAWLGLNLLEDKGKSYYYSLANKFFDYIQAGIPSLCMDFPEYRAICQEDKVAVLCSDILPTTIAQHLNHLLQDEEACRAMRGACRQASGKYIWEKESLVLLDYF